MNSQHAERYITQRLRRELSPGLTYHGLHHTLDVVGAAARLAHAEGITDAESLTLLHTAALYHDAGLLTTYADHEQAGCAIARQSLPDFDYSSDEIELICVMIMATRLPQQPLTPLARILCDADLDYLGRPDFEPIARTLFTELGTYRGMTDELTWNRFQVAFLETHHYWTDTARHSREASKQAHLAQLRRLIDTAP